MNSPKEALLDAKELNNLGIYFNELPKSQVIRSIVLCDSYFFGEMRDLSAQPTIYRFLLPKAAVNFLKFEMCTHNASLQSRPSWMNEIWAENVCVLDENETKVTLSGKEFYITAIQAPYSVGGSSFIQVVYNSQKYLFQPKFTQAAPSLKLIKELAPDVLFCNTVKTTGKNIIESMNDRISQLIEMATKKYPLIEGQLPIRVYWHPLYEIWPLIALANIISYSTKKSVFYYSASEIYAPTLKALQKAGYACSAQDLQPESILIEIDKRLSSPKTIHSFRSMKEMVQSSVISKSDKASIIFPVFDDKTAGDPIPSISEGYLCIMLPATNYLEDIFIVKKYAPNTTILCYPGNLMNQKTIDACKRDFPTQYWKIDVDYEKLLKSLQNSRGESVLDIPPRLNREESDSSDVELIEDQPATKAKIPENNSNNLIQDFNVAAPEEEISQFDVPLPAYTITKPMYIHSNLLSLGLLTKIEKTSEKCKNFIYPHKLK